MWEVADEKSEQEDAYGEEKMKMTTSQVPTLYVIWYFYNLTCYSICWGNYDSTIWFIGV